MSWRISLAVGSSLFCDLTFIETEIFAKMSKKYRNEQPWVEPLLHQTCCVSRRHNKSASPLHGLAMTSTYESWQAVHFGIFSDIFANISVPNKSKITKQRRPDSLRNSSWHKSEPAIWVVEHVCQCWHLQKLAWSLLINWQRLLHTLNIYTCIVSEINISSLLWCVRKS